MFSYLTTYAEKNVLTEGLGSLNSFVDKQMFYRIIGITHIQFSLIMYYYN